MSTLQRLLGPAAVVALVIVAVVLLPGGDGPEVPDVDVHAEAADVAPPRDALLVDADWPDVAAWVAREADAGRPTVVNLWASWCGPCRAEAPVLRAAIAAHPDVAFLGVDHRDQRDAASKFLEDERLTFATLFDPDGETAQAVAARGMPSTAFFDHTGRLVFTHTGVLTEQMLASRLADLEAAARG